MRIRNNSNASSEIEASNKFLKGKEELGKIIKASTNKKINLEIGMGKGDFLMNMAFQNRDEVFIGVEVCKSVLALAVKKIARFENEKNITLDNLFIMSFDAKDTSLYFDDNSVDKLFLNFSDPWPKSRHEKRRLTYSSFLEIYKKVLKNGSNLEFKTDNRGLFEYSLKSMNNFGMTFNEVYLDLHKVDIPNVITEYERKFSAFRTYLQSFV